MMLLQMNVEVSRGKQEEKIKVHVGMSDFYKHYCLTTFKEKKGGRTIVHDNSMYAIDRATYGQIVEFFHSRITDEIMLDNFEFKMPARMGTLSIRKRKPKLRFDEEGKLINTMPIDWKATNELWEEDPESKEKKKLVRHMNEHTNGYVPFWYYNPRTGTFRFKNAYKFNATRTVKRALSKVLKDDNINTNYYLK